LISKEKTTFKKKKGNTNVLEVFFGEIKKKNFFLFFIYLLLAHFFYPV